MEPLFKQIKGSHFILWLDGFDETTSRTQAVEPFLAASTPFVIIQGGQVTLRKVFFYIRNAKKDLNVDIVSVSRIPDVQIQK